MTAQVQQQLLDVLKKIDRPGTFCTSGRLPPTLPGLEVAGAEPVSFPLGQRQAGAIKKQAHQAPYGKGTQTLVCTKTKASYHRALQAHHVDLDHLAKIRKVVDWH